MSCHKVIVNYSGSLSDSQVTAKKKAVADALGVLPEDVVLLPGLTVSVVEVPDAMHKAREKADKEEAAAKEKAEKEAAEAAEKAAKDAEKAAKAEARASAIPPAAPEPAHAATHAHGHKK